MVKERGGVESMGVCVGFETVSPTGSDLYTNIHYFPLKKSCGISASLSLQARSSSCIRRIGSRQSFLESYFHALTRVLLLFVFSRS